MTTEVRKRPRAETDLLEIWHHLAADHSVSPDRFLDRIDEQLRQLRHSPGIGRIRSEPGQGIRSFSFESYSIFYYLEGPAGIDVIRVLHGARDIKAIFENDPAAFAAP